MQTKLKTSKRQLLARYPYVPTRIFTPFIAFYGLTGEYN